jgi:biopolymer transport protein ExbB
VTDEAYAARPQDRVRFPVAAAQRAFQRRSKFLAAQSKGGLKTFATIASSAPFIGFLGTVIGIEGSFAGPTGPPSDALARLASEIAEALIRGAMGLLVSVFAVWCFNYLRSRFEVFENEMSKAVPPAETRTAAN